MQEDRRISPVLLYGLPIILTAAIKLLIWSPQVTPFNSDEAIVALMARHFTLGQLTPFFYGQYYMGSLDAILVSLLFRLLGEHIWVIRMLQCLLYVGTVVTTVTLAVRITGSRRSALFAGILAAVPPVNVVLYTTVSLGGYGEMLLIGNLLLLSGLSLLEEIHIPGAFTSWRIYLGLFFWSMGAGFAFWVIGLSLVYTVPILLMIGWELYKTVNSRGKFLIYGALTMLLGFGLGSSPWWFSALLTQDHSIVTELLGGAIANANPGFWLLRPLLRFGSLVVFGLSVIIGMRPPWGVTWLMLPLLPFVLIFWLAVFIVNLKSASLAKNRGRIILLSIGVVLAAGFIFSPYGDDPSGRYFLPLIVPMAVLGADLITRHFQEKTVVQLGLLLVVIAFNLGGTLQSRSEIPPGLTTQFDPVAQVDHSYIDDLIGFLEDQDINTGYSNYWVAYPVAFLSEEKIILSPRLPYHQDFRYTERDDRYPLYTDLVETSDEIAYITTRNPELDDYLRNHFSGLDISWKEQRIGDYTVYYDLSAPIHVSQIGLGVTTQP